MSSTGSQMRIDCLYCRSIPAILKIIQVLSGFFGFICLQHVTMNNCGACMEWLQTMLMSGFLISLTFLIFYLFHVIGSYDKIPWLKIEAVVYFLWMIFDFATATHLSISLTTCIKGCFFGPMTTVSFGLIFAYLATIAYGCDAGMKLYRIIKGIPAQ